MESRTIILQNVENVRDLGGIALPDGRRVKDGLLYRSGALHAISGADADTLFGKLGIGCVIDLRCGWELSAKPDRLAGRAEYLHIPFFDGELVGVEYAKPLAGTYMVGHDFACDPLDFYRAMANPLTVGQMSRAVAAAFDRALDGVPVLFHCSGGKDRAGILAAVILLTLGVGYAEILADYEMTNISRDKRYQQNYERFLRLAGDPDFAREITLAHRARPENLAMFFSAVEESYGSAESFVRRQLGISACREEELWAALCV